MIKYSLLLLLLSFVTPVHSNDLNEYIDRFFDGTRYHVRKAKAKSYIPLIEKYAAYYQLDPLLIGVVISFESSWRADARGQKDEQGLMQIKNIRIRSIKQNIRVGARILRQELNRCGTLLQALNAYQTGRCKPIHWRARRRYKEYQKWVN